MKWRKAVDVRERADAVIDLRERLAPYVEAPDDDPDSTFDAVTTPVAVLEPARARGPYRPRHLAT